MLVLLASPRWRWCLGEYVLVSYNIIFCMEPENIYSGHQRHLGEANKTNIHDILSPSFDKFKSTAVHWSCRNCSNCAILILGLFTQHRPITKVSLYLQASGESGPWMRYQYEYANISLARAVYHMTLHIFSKQANVVKITF